MSARIYESFARQTFLQTLGARLLTVGAGSATLDCPLGPGLRQQHGAGHAGVSFTLGDVAAGYAALSLLPEDQEVMTSEMKIHLLRPAEGERLIARADVLKPGRRLVITRADIYAVTGTAETHIATLLGTMVPVALTLQRN